MVILIVGLVVFLGIHSVGMVAPGWRHAMVERLGEGAWKGVYSVVALAGFALIIWGFARAATETGVVYVPPLGLRHLTFALMLPALILAVASFLPPGHMRRIARHPLLIGAALWSFAHLLVNGELAAVVLFGAFLAWAVVELVGQWRRPRAPIVKLSAAYDVAAVVVGIALYGVLLWRLHEWAFGVSPAA